MRIHELEGALRAVGILAKQAVKVVEDRQDEPGRRRDPGRAVAGLSQARIGSLDQRLALDRQDLRL